MIKDGVSQVTIYSYGDNHNFPITKSFENSTGQIQTISFTYPTELTDPIYSLMVDKIMIATPIIQEKTITTGGTTVSTEKVISIFQDIYGEPHHTQTEVYPTASSELVTYRYLYNAEENVVQSQKDNDHPLVFLYDGYNYPVAKIINIQYQELLDYYPTILESIKTSTDNNQLKTDLVSLRDQLPVNTSMEICFYKVGVGMEEKIDFNGRSTFYDYDPLGRLTLIKDHEGFILQKFDYKYANQN